MERNHRKETIQSLLIHQNKVKFILFVEIHFAKDKSLICRPIPLVKNFDPAKHFNTLPELVDQPWNRLTEEQLESIDIDAPKNGQTKRVMINLTYLLMGWDADYSSCRVLCADSD